MDAPTPDYLTTKEVADLLRVSKSYLEKLRHYRRPGPPVTRHGQGPGQGQGRTVRYRRDALLAWAAAQEGAS